MATYIVRIMDAETGEQEDAFEEATPAAAMKRERLINQKLDRDRYYTQMDEEIE